MKRMLSSVLAAMVGIVPGCMPEPPAELAAVAQEGPGEPLTPEQRALLEEEIWKWRGRWQCVSRNEEGTPVPTEQAQAISLTVGGTMYHFRWGDSFDEFGHYVFHPDRSPKAIDAHIEDPPEMKGRVVHLIYRMEGDRLLLSHREDNKRPTGFVAEPESGQTVEEWVRVRAPVEAEGGASGEEEGEDEEEDDNEDEYEGEDEEGEEERSVEGE